MAVSVNIFTEGFGNSKVFSTFVEPNTLYCFENQKDSLNIRDKRAFLRLSCFKADSVFGDIQGKARRSLLYIQQIFRSQMPNTTKNLTATAPGASTSRVNRAKTVSKSRQTKADLISQKSHAKFAGLNNLRIFAVQNARLIVGQSKSIHTKFADKARSFLGVSFGNNRYGRSAKHQKSLAFFGYIHQVF